MKKIISFLLAILLFYSTLSLVDIPVYAIQIKNVVKAGDINLDDNVDVKDVYYARLIAAKLVTPTEQQLSIGDVDADGKINAIDANIIRKYVLRIISSLPNEGMISAEPVIMVSSRNVEKGEENVKVVVSIANNPGVLGMTLKLTYDEDVMTLTEVARGSALSEMTNFVKPKNLSSGCQFPWAAEEVLPEDVTNGEILVLTFSISESAPDGDYTVALSYDNGAIIDNDLNPVKVKIINGIITVK